jgi:hypothetical protein
MVKRFYPDVLGFKEISPEGAEVTEWELNISNYVNKNQAIKINEE